MKKILSLIIALAMFTGVFSAQAIAPELVRHQQKYIGFACHGMLLFCVRRSA
ncbi:MAG: hypothetical protein GXZ04_02585 [Clostridiales bacterium]|nr:hypothetical protein [Clostridiales bacterium]